MRLFGLAALMRLGPRRVAQVVIHLPNFLRLFWRLLKDPRVPAWPKLLPLLVVGYVLAPVDFLPDFLLALGQIDDLLVIFLGLRAFIRLCPREIVQEHVRVIAAGR